MSFKPSWEKQSGGPVRELTAGTAQFTLSAFFALGALACIGFGWWRMYAYDEFNGDKLVGGDALNMQILAARGAGIIAAGIGLALIAILFAIFGVAAKIDAKP